eukprot:GCRY01004212.1.p1 GENE.GCRY01004212.1~~GCRY01004212.1.p1  ORF type:complete len:273 (+),score=82.14 GCRY01004212.1:327-1145(+)
MLDNFRNPSTFSRLPREDVSAVVDGTVFVTAPAVEEIVTKQFGLDKEECAAFTGAPLEDSSAIFASSHWEKSLFWDEFMAYPSTTPLGPLSALTLAFFKDLGFYRPVFSSAAPLRYGYQGGCTFLTAHTSSTCPLTADSNIPAEYYCSEEVLGCSWTLSAVSQCHGADNPLLGGCGLRECDLFSQACLDLPCSTAVPETQVFETDYGQEWGPDSLCFSSNSATLESGQALPGAGGGCWVAECRSATEMRLFAYDQCMFAAGERHSVSTARYS